MKITTRVFIKSISFKFLFIGFGFILLEFQGPYAAQAESYLGVLAGPSFVNHNAGTDFDIGGHIGTTLVPSFSVGLYATHETLSSNSVASSGETTLAFEGNFHPPGYESVYLGGKAGIGFTSSSIFGASSSENDFVWGPAIGFNVPLLSPSISIGAEGNILFLESTNTVTFVNILGAVTFHF